MSTDRELLEAAARVASGLFHEFVMNEKTCRYVGQREWNPLTDDGDALRLAVKLGLDIETSLAHTKRVCADAWDESLEEYRRVEELRGSDPCAAVRRCIVRAAASIGAAMKGTT